jgi:hypothetical protein
LEFGTRGDISPFESKKITSYCEQLLPELYDNAQEITVPIPLAKRTYWGINNFVTRRVSSPYKKSKL